VSITDHHSSKVPYSAPLTVRLSPAFVNGLCTAPEGALRPEPGSHVANGGLLFGATEGDVVTIQACRALAICGEHETKLACGAFGKSVEALSAASIADPELSGLQLIGWCYVQSDGRTDLLQRDVEFHHRYFPRDTDLLLVLNPQEQGLWIQVLANRGCPAIDTRVPLRFSIRVSKYPCERAN
jgi:hypothetical protein